MTIAVRWLSPRISVISTLGPIKSHNWHDKMFMTIKSDDKRDDTMLNTFKVSAIGDAMTFREH